MKLKLKRWFHRHRIAAIRGCIRDLTPAALDGNEFAVNAVSRLSNRLKKDYNL